jgi:hypothetical protein
MSQFSYAMKSIFPAVFIRLSNLTLGNLKFKGSVRGKPAFP